MRNKLCLFIGLMQLWAASAYAYDVKIDGVYYNLNTNDKTASVTYYSYNNNSNAYSGSIVIPETVTDGGIIYNVTSIQARAFDECAGLSAISLPSSIVSIGDFAFSGCIGLESVKLPANVLEIGNNAFQGCKGLTSFEIPSGIIYVKSATFDGCNKLESVTIPEGVTNIDQNAFRGCSKLTSISLPRSIKSIGYGAFRNCGSIKTLILPPNLYRIDDYAFAGCTALRNVTVQCVLSGSISTEIFEGCSDMEVVFDCSTVQFLFKDCDFVKKVTFTEEVTSIGQYAFKGCSGLKEISIPVSVTSIGYEAFAGCSNVLTVYSDILSPFRIDDTAFSSTTYSGTLYVPVGTKEKYQKTDGWKNFYNITEVAEESVTLTANSYTRQYGEANPEFGYQAEGTTLIGTPSIVCEADRYSPVGEYPIVISKGSVENGNVTYINGTLTITKAPLTVKADDKTIKQGESIPDLTISYDGFRNWEESEVLIEKPIASTKATSQSEPGSYPITVSGGLAQNYSFIYREGKLTVTEADSEPHEPQSENGYVLVVTLRNGKREKFKLAERPVVWFSGHSLLVRTSTMSTTYERNDVEDFTFELLQDTGIQDVMNGKDILLRQLTDGVIVSGMSKEAFVAVYDIGGKLLNKLNANGEGDLKVKLPYKGIYILNINNERTIKIYK